MASVFSWDFTFVWIPYLLLQTSLLKLDLELGPNFREFVYLGRKVF